jgi:16S rRNA (guanine527-N7)-methyltransferase
MEGSKGKTWLGTTCAYNGLKLSEEQLALMDELAVRLLEWNQKINLISRRDEENFWSSHLLHCLALLLRVELPTGGRILDLGTGGGLPGLPLKIARPDLAFTLLDSTQKKINVVKDLIRTLRLDGVTAVWGRAEDVGKAKEHHHRYDVVLARAVASLKDLVRWSEPFLKTNGTTVSAIAKGRDESKILIERPTLITLKGGDLEGEIGQIQNLAQVKNITVLDLTLRGSSQLEGGEKKIVLVEIARTPKQKAEDQ